MPLKPYAWQLPQWQSLVNDVSEKRLPHALLLTGSQGLGKADFARAFANYLLCLQPQQEGACGVCKSCELNEVDTHPDLKWLMPEEESKQIRIPDIRQISEFVSQTAQQGGYRVVVITPAETMNINAANALLKNLEEPGSRTVFLLVSHALGRVPATIRSRCQKIVFKEPDLNMALSWLSAVDVPKQQAETLLGLAHGAPLKVRSLFEADALKQHDDLLSSLIALEAGQTSIVDVSKRWSDWHIPLMLDWLNQLISSALKQLLLREHSVKNKQLSVIIQMVTKVDARLLYDYLDHLNHARQAAQSTANINKQMLIEDLLVKWLVLVKRR